jgi:predicted metallopeptidase
VILYTELAWRAIADMARVVPAFRHIDASRVCVMAAARVSGGRHGNLAQCHALRENETRNLQYWYDRRSRRVVKVTPWMTRKNVAIELRGQSMLYMIMLRLPRLLAHDPLETLVHELVHIGPAFDGRLRRARHGARFEAWVEVCARQWRENGDPELTAPMQMNHAALTARWGPVVGRGFDSNHISPLIRPLEDPPPLASHPDFARGVVKFDPAKVEIVTPKWTPEDAPEKVTERDLVYRLYTPRRAERISAAALRTAPGLFPGFPG